MEPPRVVFGPLERPSLLLGLRGPQVAVVATGLATAAGALALLPVPVNAAFAIFAVAIAAAAALVEVGGRALYEWVPVGARFALQRATGRDRFQAATGTDAPTPLELPPPFTGLELAAAPAADGDGGEVGVVCDRRRDTYTAVLACEGNAFALLEPYEQLRLLAAWDDVLRGLAGPGSPVSCLQWLERAVPADGDTLARDLRDRLAAPVEAPWVASYLDLLDHAAPAAAEHELYLAIQVRGRDVAAHRPRRARDRAAGRALAEQLAALARRLDRAHIRVTDPGLSPRALARTLRTAVDPASRAGIAHKATHHPQTAGVDPANAWPLATETSWASFATDSARHATFWIVEWPRTPVGLDFLAPLLLATPATRTVSVVLEPTPLGAALREVEQARTTQLAEQELRESRGFLTRLRSRREQQALVRRAEELHDGYAPYRFTGYVTVSAPDADQLERACTEIEQAAQRAGLELRRLVGVQDLAFACTLPLARTG